MRSRVDHENYGNLEYTFFRNIYETVVRVFRAVENLKTRRELVRGSIILVQSRVISSVLLQIALGAFLI